MSIELAVKLHQTGRLGDAIAAYREILGASPNDFDAMHLLGVALHQSGDTQSALPLLRQALTINPASAFAWNNLGTALKSINKLEEAEQAFVNALNQLPDYPAALDNLGNLSFRREKHTEAIALHSQAIALDPNSASSRCHRAAALAALEKFDEASEDLNWALAKNPRDAAALALRGSIRLRLGETAAALEDLKIAVQLNNTLTDAHFNLGNAYRRLGDRANAQTHFDITTRLEAGHLGACNHLGAMMLEDRSPTSALPLFDAALRAHPKSAETWCNRARAMVALGKIPQARSDLEKAITANPRFIDAHVDLGHLGILTEDYAAAIRHYEAAYTLDHKKTNLAGHLLAAKLFAADWTSLPELKAFIEQSIEEGETVTSPFETLLAFDSLALQRRAAELHIRRRLPGPFRERPKLARRPNEKIRIGYFSADLFSHATAHLMVRVFELHDRDQFEIHAFSFSARIGDTMESRLARAFDRFHDVSGFSDSQIADLARQHDIHIAIDLKGYTRDCRPGVFAHGCAPIQVNFLGYPGSMGAPFIDYLIADTVVVTPELERHYSEKIVRLETCYQPNSPLSERAPTPTRAQVRLPPDKFVFCCFNHHYKIQPEVFASWLRILQAVPDSVLWLYAPVPVVRDNLTREASKQGLDPSRLVWADRVSHPEHLARQALGDLFLDTYPYTAHTTASDALRSGLPVLTRCGETFASRVAASLLTHIGVSELITSTTQEYEAKAVALARNPTTLQSLRDQLIGTAPTSLLYDSAAFTRHFERALLELLKEHARG